MNCEPFPECCVAHVITDFGESVFAEGGNHPIKKEKLVEYIKKEALKYDSHAMLTAVTNNEQKVANKTLKSLNFKHSKWMSKAQHPNTKVRLWYIHIEDLL